MLVDKRLRSVYPLMLPMGQGKKTTAAIENTRFNTCKFGSYKSVVADFNLNNDGHRGNVPALSATIGSSDHNVTATAAILDGGKSVDYFVKGSPDYVFLSDRTDGYDKVYWQRSSQTNMITAYAGDVMSGAVGFKIEITQ